MAINGIVFLWDRIPDCLAGMQCYVPVKKLHDAVRTCHPLNENADHPGNFFAQKGSCNVNTGKPANIFIECVVTCNVLARFCECI